MGKRAPILLAGAAMMFGAPAPAAAECPPTQQADGEVVIEIEISQQGSRIPTVPVLSNRLVTFDYVPTPAVMQDPLRDPANAMINRLGLVEVPDVIRQPLSD